METSVLSAGWDFWLKDSSLKCLILYLCLLKFGCCLCFALVSMLCCERIVLFDFLRGVNGVFI